MSKPKRMSASRASVLMCICVFVCLCLSLVHVLGERDDVITTTVYGEVNQSHTTTLPNSGEGGVKYHYLLNNLPIAHASLLSSIRFLFTVNPSASSASSVPSIIVHIARPEPTSNQPNRVRYVASQPVTNIQSNVAINLIQYNIGVRPGDIIALSVPNDSILLRVGANNQGLPVSYGRLTVATGVANRDVEGAYEIQDPNPDDTEYFQLCGTFETQYGYTGTISNFVPFYGVTFGGIYTFLNEPMTHSGVISSIRFGVWSSFDGAVDIVNPSISTLELVIARQSPAGSGMYYIDPTTITSLPTVQSFVDLPLNIPTLTVQQGDLVGFGYQNPRSLDGPYVVNLPANTGAYLGIDMSSPDQALTPRFQSQGIQSQPAFEVTITSRVDGDPQFAGFQGQQFQFHGLADEHFNLISAPQLQLNSHFVYLSSGNCNYNNTLCFQHPGTYLDVLGFTIPSASGTAGDVRVKVIAGAHADGLRVWMSQSESDVETEIKLGAYPHGLTWAIDADGNKATLKYNKFGEVSLRTPMFDINVVNSDFFFNLGLSLLDASMLRIGRTKHTITDHEICNHDKHGHAHVNEEEDESSHITHDHGAVEEQLIKKYHVTMPLHGLIGQTWRNVKVCGKDWMGSVNDYVVSSLFGVDYYYNFYKSNSNSTVA